jgi:RNA polymerase sigma-70 factor (ECF subfamily)
MTDRVAVVPGAAGVVAAWFDRHAASISGYAARRVGPTIARDVVADTFRVALEQFDAFEPSKGSEQAWLLGIATNLMRRHWRAEERRLRAQARQIREGAQAIDPMLEVEEVLDARQAYERLIDVVAQLPAEDRDLLVLVAWEGMTSPQAAAVLGVPAGTVRSRLHRIRTQLAEGHADG